MRIFVYESTCAAGPDVADSLRREGQAMLAAVTEDFRRLPSTQVRQIGPETFREAAALHDWTLVIAPEFDDLLGTLSQTVLDAGGRLLGSTPEAIRLAADKLAIARFWHARGLLHPNTAAELTSMPTPCVLKPRFGAGSQATFLIRDEAERERAIQAARAEWPSELIVQSYVAGQAASVALLMGETQTTPLLPARQHLSDDGRFRFLGGSLPLPEPLASRAANVALQAVAGIAGLRGYVGVDLVLGDDGSDYVIEINPRLTTSYLGLRQLCKQNLAEAMLRLAQGETIEPLIWNAGEVHFQPDHPTPENAKIV